ncbi:MAG: type II secretion system secretin GspD [Planctomycetes bacterium]|nr:type II secretion system secretin GspD [Planctomycetota bacterium]
MKKNAVLALFALLGLAAFSAPAVAQGGGPMMPINFRDMPLEDFLEAVTNELKGIESVRFLYKPEVRQVQINLFSTVDIPKKNLMDVVRLVLQFNGFLLIEEGTGPDWKIYRVLRDTQGRWEPPTLYKNEEGLAGVEGYRYVTFVVPLKYASAKEVQGALKLARVTHPNVGNIVGIESSNTLLISDYAPMVKMLLEVVKLMDIPTEQLSYRVFDLSFASAEEVKTKLTELLTAQQQAQAAQPGVTLGQRPTSVAMVAFERTQKLLVQSSPERLDEIAQIVREIDVPMKGPAGRIHVVPLKHAKADEVAKVLNELAEPLSATVRSQERTGVITVERGPGGGTITGTTGPTEEEETKPSVVADTNTNSLIVAASPAEWAELERIIEALDRLLPQVLIEVAIVELSPEDILTLGVELATIDDPAEDSTRGFAATTFGLSQLVDKDGRPITAQNPGIPVGRLPTPGSTGLDTGLFRDNIFRIPALLRVLKVERDLRVLSMPRLLTNDNQQASLKVSEAFPITQFVTTTGVVQQSFDQFEAAGTELKITPHISSANYLRLDIEQKLEVFTAAQTSPSVPPPKTTREITTSITIPDHQTVVIGGLRANNYRETVLKIPILGDIPVVGYLFKSTEVSIEETQIYIFVTPHILKERDFKDLHKISYDDKVELENLGGDLRQVDPNFVRYRTEQEMYRERGRLDSLYMLEYRSPTEKR